MKNIILSILIIILYSCNKGIELDGTTWINQYGTEQFEFYENDCKYTMNTSNSGNVTSVFYTYEYKTGKITLLAPSMSGFYNYTGDVSKNKMILYPILKDSNGKDSIVHADEFRKVFHIK